MLVYSICILAGAYATDALPSVPGHATLTALGIIALVVFLIVIRGPLPVY